MKLGLPLRVGAQDEGVDEEADQVVKGLVGASGDRGTYGDVGSRSEPGQQHRQTGLQDHEHRHALLTGQLHQPSVQMPAGR